MVWNFTFICFLRPYCTGFLAIDITDLLSALMEVASISFFSKSRRIFHKRWGWLVAPADDVFCLCRRLSYHILLHWISREHGWTKCKIISMSAFHIINDPCPVTIWITHQLPLLFSFEQNTIISTTFDITQCFFRNTKINFTWRSHKPWQKTYCEHEVRSSCCQIQQATIRLL